MEYAQYFFAGLGLGIPVVIAVVAGLWSISGRLSRMEAVLKGMESILSRMNKNETAIATLKTEVKNMEWIEKAIEDLRREDRKLDHALSAVRKTFPTGPKAMFDPPSG